MFNVDISRYNVETEWISRNNMMLNLTKRSIFIHVKKSSRHERSIFIHASL
jgi:hypothetical protein